MRMRHVLICDLSRSTIFCHLIPKKKHDFREKAVLYTRRFIWFSLQLSCETFLILRWDERDVITTVYRSSWKAPFNLVRFQWKLNFLDRFSKSPQISSFIRIRPVWAELFHEDGQTDGHDEAESHFTVLRTHLKVSNVKLWRKIYLYMYVCMYVYRVQNVFLRCPTPRLHCFLSSHWPSFRFLSFMAIFIPSIQLFFGLPRALFCFGIHFNAILGSLSSAILWTWPYHVSWFCSISFITENLFTNI